MYRPNLRSASYQQNKIADCDEMASDTFWSCTVKHINCDVKWYKNREWWQYDSRPNLEKTDSTETLMAKMAIVSPPSPMLGSITCSREEHSTNSYKILHCDVFVSALYLIWTKTNKKEPDNGFTVNKTASWMHLATTFDVHIILRDFRGILFFLNSLLTQTLWIIHLHQVRPPWCPMHV